MEHKFKVGDYVTVGEAPGAIKPEGYSCFGMDTRIGEQASIFEIENDHIRLKFNDGTVFGCFSVLQLTKVSGARNPHGKPTRFILTFDQQYESFPSEKEMRARIAELAKEPVADRTYTVYDIKRTRTVTLGVKITIK